MALRKPSWMRKAFGELGTVEKPGPGSTPRVIEYHQTTTLKATDDSVPWCSAFANWVLKQDGITGTGSAAALSWKDWGEELIEPVYGCIVVLERPGGPGQGHVAFFIEMDDKFVYLLGGNQSDAVKVSRFPKDRIISFRYPA